MQALNNQGFRSPSILEAVVFYNMFSEHIKSQRRPVVLNTNQRDETFIDRSPFTVQLNHENQIELKLSNLGNAILAVQDAQ